MMLDSNNNQLRSSAASGLGASGLGGSGLGASGPGASGVGAKSAFTGLDTDLDGGDGL